MTSQPDFSENRIREKLSGSKILLVGGLGFIGHNLALLLARYGAKVTVMDNMMVNSVVDHAFSPEGESFKQTLNLRFLFDRIRLLKEAGVALVNGDARLERDINLCMDQVRPNKVVHLAAIASAVEARKQPGLMFDLQLVVLRNILEYARSPGNDYIDQIMLLSSSTVYGDFEGDSVDENTRPQPRGIYANSKYMGERLMRTYSQQYGLGTTIIRPSALYGERCVSRRVSQAFIENALMGKPLLLEGGGDGKLDFTYIDDLTDGMARALAFHGGRDTTNTFNLTFGGARTIAELAAIIKDLLPEAILEERPRANDKPIRGTLSIERAEKVLGYKSNWPLERGYRQYCEWYIEEFRRAKAEQVKKN